MSKHKINYEPKMEPHQRFTKILCRSSFRPQESHGPSSCMGQGLGVSEVRLGRNPATDRYHEYDSSRRYFPFWLVVTVSGWVEAVQVRTQGGSHSWQTPNLQSNVYGPYSGTIRSGPLRKMFLNGASKPSPVTRTGDVHAQLDGDTAAVLLPGPALSPPNNLHTGSASLYSTYMGVHIFHRLVP